MAYLLLRFLGMRTNRLRAGIRIGRAAAAAAAGCLAALPLLTAVPGISGDITAIMREVRRLESLPLWPGFAPAAVPAAVFDEDTTYLFDFPHPPKGFRVLKEGVNISVFQGRHPSVIGNRRILLDGVWVATSIPQMFSPDSGRSYSTTEMAGVILHEKFHVFQALRHPDWRPNDALLLTYPLDTPASLALRTMEMEALRRAVSAGRERDAAGWAGTALRFRRDRLALLPERYAVYEREVQLLEGTAEYVEFLTVGRGPFDGLPISGFAPKAAREMGYRGGRWIAVLLDRLDPSWKERLEAGEFRYLEDRLEACLPRGREPITFSPEEQSRFWEDAAVELAAEEEERKSRLKEFYDKMGVCLDFIAAEKPLRLEMFDPLTTETVGDRRMIHSQWIVLRNDNGVLEVIDRPCLTEVNDLSQVVRFVVPGVSRRTAVNHWLDRVTVAQEGITAAFRGARVSVRPENVRISLK